MKKHRIISYVLTALLLLSFMCSCRDSEKTSAETEISDTAAGTEAETETAAWDGTLDLSEQGNFIMVRSDSAEKTETASIVSFRKKLNETLGFDLDITTDWVKEKNATVENSDFEILIGRTNRKESKELLEQIGDRGYGMTVTENKLVINATDASCLVLAFEKFEKDILGNSEKCKDGVIKVSREDSYCEKVETAYQLSDVIESGLNYQVTLTAVVTCNRIDEYYVGQGAASDGTYVYFVLRTKADGYAKIAKYELESGKFVAASDPVYVFHGNDMTYCKSTNQLVLVHGSSEGKILTLMDADTLKVTKQTQNIGAGAGAITYSVAKDMFAFSQGGSSLYFMNSDFTGLSQNYSRKTNSDYTAQGMGSDEKYVYFPMSGSSDNILAVYDWNGLYVTDVHLPTTLESESMFWVNDTYYVNFHRAGVGPQLYRLDVELAY